MNRMDELRPRKRARGGRPLCGALLLLAGAAAALFLPRAVLAVFLACACALLAALALAGDCLSRELDKLRRGLREVGDGNFDIRMRQQDGRNPLRRYVLRSCGMEETAREFDAMAAALGANAYQRKDFVRCISHEFQTPINVIRGFSGLLGQELPPEERRRDSLIVREEADRLARLSDNLLLMSRLESGAPAEPPQPFSLDEQLREVLIALEPEWGAKGLRLEPDLEPVTLCGYRDLLREVWTNLLGNAVKFSPQGGALRVALRRGPDGSALAEVADEGPGIPPGQQAQVFELFYQTEAGRLKRGSGVGLALSRRIVEACGGAIAVESEPGRGAAFTVRLPAGPERRPAAGESRERRAEVP